jgi:hypothetical protein
MLPRIALLGAAVLVLTAACTNDPASAPLPEPVEVETCDGLVDVGVIYVERMVLALDGLGIDVLTGEAQPPVDVAALIDLGEELDRRVARLDCDVDALNAEIAAETSELDGAGDPVIELFLGIVRGGVIGDVPAAPPATTTTTGG